MQSKICIICGKEFFKKQNYSKKYWLTAKCCSPKCGSTGKHNKLGKTGYKHTEEAKRKIGIASKKQSKGLSNLTRQTINLFEYRQWRSDVFTRDNFKCQICGSNKKIQAHHIKSRSLIVKENNLKTIEDVISCEELWNINNGQTLCDICHRKTDNYGFRARKQLSIGI
jgi:hypothetical protein